MRMCAYLDSNRLNLLYSTKISQNGCLNTHTFALMSLMKYLLERSCRSLEHQGNFDMLRSLTRHLQARGYP